MTTADARELEAAFKVDGRVDAADGNKTPHGIETKAVRESGICSSDASASLRPMHGAHQKDRDNSPGVVFIDETGASTKMARLYGRSPYGQRCVAALPHGHWKTTTLVGALRATGMTAPMLLDGPIDGLTFEAYVTQVLVPTLKPGDIVVMDNLAAHKRVTEASRHG